MRVPKRENGERGFDHLPNITDSRWALQEYDIYSILCVDILFVNCLRTRPPRDLTEHAVIIQTKKTNFLK